MIENQKKENAVLADYSHLFTPELLKIAAASLTDNEIKKPTFMTKVPGRFYVTKQGLLNYEDSDGFKRALVSQNKRQALMQKLWESRIVPRGQASFANYITRRYIGVQQKMIRDFVAKKVGIQMVIPLANQDLRKRAIRSNKPFDQISIDLADMISFSDIRGKEEDRFVFILVDNFSGFLYHALLPLGKDGRGVAKAFRKILKKIKKIGGHPKILVSDLGKEFYNSHVQNVNKEFQIKHLKPKTGARIAPFVENAVRQFKRYVRLNSHLLFSNSKWFEPQLLKDSVTAVNNIQSKSGFSPKEIIKNWQKHGKVVGKVKSYHKREDVEDDTSKYNLLTSGDFVRIRVAKQKLGLDYKSHLGFKADYYEQPISWSLEVYRVIRMSHMRRLRKHRYMLSNNNWYNRSDLLKIPKNTEVYNLMKPPKKKVVREPPQIVSQPTPNVSKPKVRRRRVKIEEPKKQQGRRSGRLRQKKRINYAE